MWSYITLNMGFCVEHSKKNVRCSLVWLDFYLFHETTRLVSHAAWCILLLSSLSSSSTKTSSLSHSGCEMLSLFLLIHFIISPYSSACFTCFFTWYIFHMKNFTIYYQLTTHSVHLCSHGISVYFVLPEFLCFKIFSLIEFLSCFSLLQLVFAFQYPHYEESNRSTVIAQKCSLPMHIVYNTYFKNYNAYMKITNFKCYSFAL